MAGLVTMPTAIVAVTTSKVDLMAAVPASTIETVSVSVTLSSGTADAYVNLWLEDAASTDGYVRWNELIRYRTQGGSQDLVLGFRLSAGQKLQIEGSASSVMTACIFNRTQDDA